MTALVVRVIRQHLLPALLVGVVAAAFARALPVSSLVAATVVAVVLGWVVVVALGFVGVAVRSLGKDRTGLAMLPAGVVFVAAGLVGGVALLGHGADPTAPAEALGTFLSVGLPASGLDQLGLVVLVVLYPLSLAIFAASSLRFTLTTVALPVLALGLIGVLVAPVGIAWWVPLALAALAGAVLVIDGRDELAELAPLTDEPRHQRGGLRRLWSLAQLLPGLAVAVLVLVTLPTPDTFDPRQFVEPRSTRFEDPNPLAVAARWQLLDDPAPAARVRVDGEVPGRLRLAVLDEYTATGWRQSADFAVTGEHLLADPLFEDLDPDERPVEVSVSREEGLSGFRAVPTAGIPRTVDAPDRHRFAPEPGVLLELEPDRRTRYRTDPGPLVVPQLTAPVVSSHPEHLVACPRSETLRDLADQLSEGATSASERLDRIESWLLTRRVYDPEAPGGQTLAAVERFAGQPFARGNLEVFVTTYAVLARCADVPVRVVVGFSAPQPGQNTYDQSDIRVWVEAPLVDTGWVPVDPLPTPEEQELLAQLARQTPPQTPEPPDTTPPPVEVDPVDAPTSSDPTTGLLLAAAAIVLVLVALAAIWTVVAPRWIVRRRRRFSEPTLAVEAAWTTVIDALADREVPIRPSDTPTEVARLCADQVPAAARWLIAGVAPLADRSRFGPGDSAGDDAGQAWGHTTAILERLPSTGMSRLVPLAHPIRVARRLRATSGVERRREPWTAELPDTALLSGAEAPADLPNVDVQARIGEGSTGVVYRGVHQTTGSDAAIKVFRFGPGDPGFDQQRFDWEVRVATGVSGLPHLPEVLDAGITPVTNRAYLVSTLHERGTLLDRVRRGGPLTMAEAIDLGVDLGAALDALHQLGVVHGDVKPENVFADADGWVLGDLGSAWLRASRGPAASLTPPYAAPEVWRGASPTPTSDLYSLALTMLFARTGGVPIAGNPPTLAEVEAAFPDHPVVGRALDPTARRRPRGVAEFVRRLRPEVLASTIARTRTLSLPTPTVSHSRDRA